MPAPGVDTRGEERASYLLGCRNGEIVTQRSLLGCSRARQEAPGGRESHKVVGEPAHAWRAASMTQGVSPAGLDTVNLDHVGLILPAWRQRSAWLVRWSSDPGGDRLSEPPAPQRRRQERQRARGPPAGLDAVRSPCHHSASLSSRGIVHYLPTVCLHFSTRRENPTHEPACSMPPALAAGEW
jgi:hypothetical protein